MTKNLTRIETLERKAAAKRMAKSFPNGILRHGGVDSLPLPLSRVVEKGWPLYVRRAWDRMEGESEEAFERRVLRDAPRGMLMAPLPGE